MRRENREITVDLPTSVEGYRPTNLEIMTAISATCPSDYAKFCRENGHKTSDRDAQLDHEKRLERFKSFQAMYTERERKVLLEALTEQGE